MARMRMLKPEFFLDEDVAKLPPLTRLAFQGLWCQADRAGRLEDRPDRLKVSILPYDRADMAGILAELERGRFIVRYEAGGRRYIQVRTFGQHQHPHIKEPASTIPAPDEHGASMVLAPTEHVASTPESEYGVGVRSRSTRGRQQSPPSGADAPAPLASVEAFVEAWNTHTTPPIARCRELTTARRTHIAARLRERPLEAWGPVFDAVEASAFCRGENERGWHATVDWILRPDTATKVLEGQYNGRRRSPRELEADAERADFAARVTRGEL